ncbi:MAG: hypothetical protein WAW75_04395 [Gallionella sp.]
MTTLPKQIRQEINQLAHRLAVRYEYVARDSILAELIEIADSGADLNQISQALIKIEASRKRF